MPQRVIVGQFAAILLLFFAYAGDAPPMVNEAHYLVKAKNFWDPSFCSSDLFAASGKAHWLFYVTFGWITKFASLWTTAWIGRWIGWSIIAGGIVRLSHCCGVSAEKGSSYPSPLVIAIVWIAGIHYGNLAGEWIVGGIEAKVPAYGLVLFAIAEIFQRNWGRVWVLLGIASAFHVLTGGWSVIAAMIAWGLIERTHWVHDHWVHDHSAIDSSDGNATRAGLITRWMMLGGLLSLLGLVPAMTLSMGGSPEDSALAARTYSYYRISHHLTPRSFPWWWYVRYGVVLLLTVGMYTIARPVCRVRGALLAWTCGAMAIGVCGLVIGLLPPVAPDIAAKLLRYYWFRLPDAVLPLSLGILVASSMAHGVLWRRRIGYTIASISLALLLVHCVERIDRVVPPSVDNRLLGWDTDAKPETLRQVYRDWLLVCDWARKSTPPDEVFLTPRHQQTFKWYAERGEVVNWKDIPQDIRSLVQWRHRFEEVFPARLNTLRVTIHHGQLSEYRKRFGVRFMIVDRRVCGENLPLVRLYPRHREDNPTYAVYELPP